MAGGGQQQQGGMDNAYAPIWIIAMCALFGGLGWFLFRAQIVGFIFFVKLWQAKMIVWLLNKFAVVAVKVIPIVHIQNLSKALVYMQATDPTTVPAGKMLTVMNIVSSWIKWPVCFIAGILAWRLHASNFLAQYKTPYNMKSLLIAEAHNWPQVAPVSSLDLVKVDINTGPWSMALTPLDFAEKHNLLTKELIQVIEPNGRKGPIEVRVKVDKAGARRVFTSQLGAYWHGVKSLSPQMKFIFAACLARIERDRDAGQKLLDQASLSYNAKKNIVNLSGADAIIKRHQSSKVVQKIVNQHAYVYTVMAAMMVAARDDGVFPSSDFLWMKPYDRRLWYVLNCAGRVTPYPEVAGIYAHFYAEREVKRRCMVPIVDEAVKGLEMAISEIKFKPPE